MVFVITIGEVIGLTVFLFYMFLFLGMVIDDAKNSERLKRERKGASK